MLNRHSVLFIITKSNFGGAQRYVFDLALALTHSGWDVLVAAGGTGEPKAPPGKLATLLAESNIPIRPITAFMRNVSLRNDLQACIELYRLLRKERPAVVHLNSSKAGGIGALAARIARIPTIVFTIHGMPTDEDRPFWQRILIGIATYGTMMLCHQVIALSKETSDRLQKFPFAKSRITLIQNGIGPFPLLSKVDAQNALAHLLGKTIDPTIPMVGTIAELTPNKHVSAFIDAIGILTAEGVAIRSIIIGDGEERTQRADQIAKLNIEANCTLAGFIPDARQYMSACDMFVLPSMKEGWPYVILEAGYAGCPVIATNTGGIPEMLEGNAGIVTPPHSPQAIAEAVRNMLAKPNDRAEYAKRLKEKVSSEYTIAAMVTKTISVYKSQSA